MSGDHILIIFLGVVLIMLDSLEEVGNRVEKSQVGKCEVVTYRGDTYIKAVPECRSMLEILSKEGSL